MNKILFVFTFLSPINIFASHNLLAPPKYSCELIDPTILDRDRCDVMPTCQYQDSKCVGTIEILPRFIHEFIKDTNHIFSVETVLKNADLPQLSMRYKSLAKFINEYKIKDPKFLNAGFLTAPENASILKKIIDGLSKYGLTLHQYGEYPSIKFLAHEDLLQGLATKTGIPVLTLLKTPQEVISTLYNEMKDGWSLSKNLKLLGLSFEDFLGIENLSPFQHQGPKFIEALITKVKLTPQQILKIGSTFHTQEYDALANCIHKVGIPWDWMVKSTNTYYSIEHCEKIKNLADTLHIPVTDLPTEDPYKWVEKNGVELEKLKNEFGLSIQFLLSNEFNTTDVDTVRRRMRTFDISAEDALLTRSNWEMESPEKIEQLSKDFGVSIKDIIKVDSYHYDKPSFLKNYKIMKFPWATIQKNPYILKVPETVKELMELWISETKPKEIMFIPYQIESLAKNPEIARKFIADWKIYKKLIHFQKFLEVNREQNELEYKSAILSNAILNGNLESVKKIPFLNEAGSILIQDHGLPFIYAKKLGYEDIAKFMSQYKSRVVHVDTTLQKKVTQCPLEEDEEAILKRRSDWYDRCNDKDPSNLVFLKNVGSLIENQISFWNTTHVKSVTVPKSTRKDVEESLEYYKGVGSYPMATYLANHKTESFPFLDKTDSLGAEINAANFALLLAPKSKFEMTVYRGQRCTEDWIRNPYRFWSTSADVQLAKNWGGSENCLIEIRIPKGFPVFFLNIASMNAADEHEFLLPSHALNKSGMLVPVHYEILKGPQQKEYVKTEYDAEHEVEYQYHFVAKSYLVKPAGDLMIYEGKMKFEDFERKYRERVCSSENVDAPGFEYLKHICNDAF